MTELLEMSLEDQCRAIWDATVAQEEADRRARREPPLTRIWSGDFNMAFVLESEYTAEFTWIDNEVGTGLTEIPLNDPVAKWIWQVRQRVERGEKRNVFITVNKDGAQWSGRLYDHTVSKKEDGTRVLVVRWLHDLDMLRHYLVWCNPFLPDFVQFPRVFFLAGPSIWTLKTALFLNVMREQESLWELPDDPMDQGSVGMSNWSVVVKPTTFMDDLNAGTIWSVPNSRFKYWMDMAKDILEDAQLSIQVRRFIETDDEQPIAGETLRNGCLVVDIVDKSGYYTDTSNGGNPFTGLLRTFAQFTEDFFDEVEEEVIDPTVPDSYKIPGLRLTEKTCPYVVYLEGAETGIESSNFIYRPSTTIQVVAGGHSFPFVNEGISASVQTAGDLLAAAVFIPPIGGAIDAIAQVFYWDTIAAWCHARSPGRVAQAGWARPFESIASASDRAYTLEALLSIRKELHETRSWFSHELFVRDGAPWFIGDNGKGHYFIGDRIGAQVIGDFNLPLYADDFTIYVDRVRELTLAWDRESMPEWRPTIGEKEKNKDRGQRALNMIANLGSVVQQLAVQGR
ncbi:phage tail protein [Nocardia brasiliensis]|uniref:Gp37-like protein n=1 Tax=Nocardia brasiliensis TaxID=37326 RepID=UPI00245801DC|nr:phage tail protein [Nocardia brasiliensis]